MQKYENNLNILSEFLDFLKYKIENNKLTLSEIEGLKKIFSDNLSLTGTAEEMEDRYSERGSYGQRGGYGEHGDYGERDDFYERRRDSRGRYM